MLLCKSCYVLATILPDPRRPPANIVLGERGAHGFCRKCNAGGRNHAASAAQAPARKPENASKRTRAREPENATVLQGFLEGGNVSPVEMMTELISVQRNFETLHQVIRTYKEMDSSAVNLTR